MNTTTNTPKPGSARWLSAAGHPGYGPGFASKVRDLMVQAGEDLRDLRLVSAWAFQARRA